MGRLIKAHGVCTEKYALKETGQGLGDRCIPAPNTYLFLFHLKKKGGELEAIHYLCCSNAFALSSIPEKVCL